MLRFVLGTHQLRQAQGAASREDVARNADFSLRLLVRYQFFGVSSHSSMVALDECIRSDSTIAAMAQTSAVSLMAVATGGSGGVWHREAQVDRWTAVDSFTYPVGAGVVTATWTCSHREVRAIYTLHSSALSHARNSGLCLIPARQVAYLHSALRHLTEARC